MSNKNRMMAGKMNRNHFRFSIRKLSIGAASVLLGLGFAGAAHQVANAAYTSMSGVVHVNPVAAHPTWKIALYNGNGKFAHQYISANTNWKVFAKKSINGEDYYKIGNDSQWVKAEYVDASGAAEVAVKAIYTVGSNPVNLVDGNGNATGASLPAGSRWKAFAKKTINGKVYYRLGTNKQWAPADGGSLEGNVADEGSSTTANNGDYYEPLNPDDNTNPSTPTTPTDNRTDAQKNVFDTDNPIVNSRYTHHGYNKISVANPAKLGNDVLHQIKSAIWEAHPNQGLLNLKQEDNGDLTITYADHSTQTIPLATVKSVLVNESNDAAN